MTWTNGPLTASQLNTEVRDHLNWLRGFANTITLSPADSGTATYLRIIRATVADYILSGNVTGEAHPRIRINAEGNIGLGPGSATFDVYLGRGAVGRLLVTGDITVTGMVGVLVKNGAPADSDFASTPFNGALALNQSTHELYVRSNGAWRKIATTV